MLNFMKKVLFPPRCPVCDKVVDQRFGMVCPGCQSRLPYVREPRCMICGKPVLNAETECCPDCAANAHAFRQGRAAFVYQDPMKQSMYRYKYSNRREYAAFYAKAFVEQNAIWLSTLCLDAIVPIPVHPKRYQQRGYNQAALVAREIGSRINVPVREDVLLRVRQTDAQKHLDAKERKNNLKSAFKTTVNELKLKNILLVDDIFTTGSTVDAAAVKLRAVGAETIYVASICIGKAF